MSDLRVIGMTVSCDLSNKNYGTGTGRFFTISSKVPEASPGIPITDLDDVMSDGVEMYFTAWQAALQASYATGDIDAEEFKQKTAAFIVRIAKIKALYKNVIKGKTNEQLEEFLRRSVPAADTPQ